jgi:hypothetical protein
MFPSPPDGLETKLEPAWYFYLAEIALRRLKNRILSSLYQSDNAGPGMDREEIALDFEEQTDAWCANILTTESGVYNAKGLSFQVSISSRSISVQLYLRVGS